METGGLTVAVAEALLSDEAVFQFILDSEGMQRGGLILGTGILLEESMGKRCFRCQPIHRIKGQDTLKEIHSCDEMKRGSEQERKGKGKETLRWCNLTSSLRAKLYV